MTAIDPFGAALQHAMLQMEMSPDQLSEKTGIPPAMLRMHLAGLHRPNDIRIERIEKVLDLDPGQLGNLPLPPKEPRKRPFQ